jgi:hypothetical protein
MSADGYIETILETLYDAKSQLSDEEFGNVLDAIKDEFNM